MIVVVMVVIVCHAALRDPILRYYIAMNARAFHPPRRPHRPPQHGGRARGVMVRARHRADRLRRGAAALRARPRLDLAAGVDPLRACGAVPARRRLDPAGGRPRARRRVLCAALRRAPRRGSICCGALLLLLPFALAIIVFCAALCGALLGDPGTLARDQRAAAGVPAQDADPAVRAAARAAGRGAGDRAVAC